ncbi:transposase [Methanonatronarchaeum sp. AMET-Sl]|uniref:RNA-guided endonuclease InsQ/TnpB family protein n=1 Tax=Methanonatronarchaeum sp. AMET-Sl TaxID=3037654 RepID=UPI00244E383A|nr:transposase [Methanonatronarchaeum sp. AMET-Sl]WGI16728.1 transposase [Methanonatronarchaeum sp. AMET-Sl]
MVQTLQQNLANLDAKEYEVLRSMSHLSKNLYNKTLYEVRQHYFNNGEYLNYYDAYDQLKDNWNYKVLPSQVAQQTMKQVDRGFKSFFNLVEKKRQNKYDANIRPPSYLDKDGFYTLEFPSQSFQVNKDHIRLGVPYSYRNEFNCDLTEIKIPFTYTEVQESNVKRVQILPRAKAQYFEYRVIYEKEVEEIETKEGSWLGIDLGVDNLATCCDWRGKSFILDGRHLKSLNHRQNQKIAYYQSIKDKQGIDGTTQRIENLHQKRRYTINDYLNKSVRLITDYCIEHRIDTVYVGDGKGWKQNVNLRDKTNQNFVQIPFDKFKQKLKHKLEARGITFELVPESHTSKCSFYDEEAVEHHDKYVGERVERGLFESSDGTRYNADVNGAVNMARKATGKPNSDLFKSEKGVERAVDAPQRISLSDLESGQTLKETSLETPPSTKPSTTAE